MYAFAHVDKLSPINYSQHGFIMFSCDKPGKLLVVGSFHAAMVLSMIVTLIFDIQL